MARIQRLAHLTTLPFVLDEAHKSRTSRLEQVVSFGQKTLGKTFYTAKQREEREERVLGLVTSILVQRQALISSVAARRGHETKKMFL